MANRAFAAPKLTRVRTLELYAVRQVLEGQAARFAAQHANAGEIAALERMITAFARALHNPSQLAKINRDFHRTVREASHNAYLMRTLDEFDTTLSVLPGTTLDAPGRGNDALEEHMRIVKAIKLRDPEAAEHAARHHMQRAQDVRLAQLFALAEERQMEAQSAVS